MAGCKHEQANGHGAKMLANAYGVVQERCSRCGATLSLGPSNDASAAVQVEIRAAEIASTIRRFGTLDNLAENIGWDGEYAYYDPPNSGFDAGYLARAIHDHDQLATSSVPGRGSDGRVGGVAPRLPGG